MKSWITQSTWQNFSSMVREAYEADGARTSIEKSHHLTATLYFSIAALEAFLNERMRKRLRDEGADENAILERLRKGKLKDKLKKWPVELTGSAIPGVEENLQLLLSVNELRGELTHPKYTHHGKYRELSQIQPFDVVQSTSEYIVKYCVSAGEIYPYWVFGWNYLNPSQGTYEICLINDQQFMHSVQALGYRKPTPTMDWYSELRSIDGYRRIHVFLFNQGSCEPKHPLFVYQPKLCKFWWRSKHQESCGNVTREAIDHSLHLDGL